MRQQDSALIELRRFVEWEWDLEFEKGPPGTNRQRLRVRVFPDHANYLVERHILPGSREVGLTFEASNRHWAHQGETKDPLITGFLFQAWVAASEQRRLDPPVVPDRTPY